MLLGFFETPIFYWEDLGCFDESKEGLGRVRPEGLVEIFVHVTPKQERPRWGPGTEGVKGRQTAEAVLLRASVSMCLGHTHCSQEL